MLMIDFNYKEYMELGDNINRIMKIIKESSPGGHYINCRNEQESKAMFVISNMIDWQKEVNKKVDITTSDDNVSILMTVTDFVEHDLGFDTSIMDISHKDTPRVKKIKKR